MQSGTALMPQTPRANPQPVPKLVGRAGLPKPWLILPALTGGLLALCYFPFDWGFLAWIALAPLLFMVRLDARPWRIYLGGFLGGCVFFYAVLTWMTVADYRMVVLWGLLATYCALYFPTALFIIRRLDMSTRWPLTITVPVVWTGLEFLRSFFLTGFAWYFLGHSQHNYLPVIQAADLGGVYVITFVMAALSGWLVEALSALPEVGAYCRQVASPYGPPRRLGVVPLVLLAALLAYGGWRLGQEQFQEGPRVALLQGNIDQRFHVDRHSREQINEYYKILCKDALKVAPPPDLLIWPESAYPYPWIELPQDLNRIPADRRDTAIDGAMFFRKCLRDLVAAFKTPQLIGLSAHVWNEEGIVHPYTSALLLTGEGNTGGRYDKTHPIPFGEYVPLREWIPFIDKFSPFNETNGIAVGQRLTRFALGNFHFGVVICNEDTDPFLARRYARADTDGPAVDFLVNISNDGWFDGSSEHAEHLAISRFRAVETRRAMCRAVNMGISAVIDGNGRVQGPKELSDIDGVKLWGVALDNYGKVPELPAERWRDYTKIHGVLTATIPIDKRVSIYALVGDWLPVSCWLLVGGVWVWRKGGRLLGVAR